VLTDAGQFQFTLSFVLVVIAIPVADLTVMLALMAGRNIKEGMAVVQTGNVRPLSKASRSLVTEPHSSGPATHGRRSGFADPN